MTDAHEDIRKHVKLYIAVFIALAVFTVLTVAASLLHVSDFMHVTIALLIAAVKAGLVAAVFMHLKWEKTITLWACFLLCAIFFVFLMVLPVLTVNDLPPGVRMGTWG